MICGYVKSDYTHTTHTLAHCQGKRICDQHLGQFSHLNWRHHEMLCPHQVISYPSQAREVLFSLPQSTFANQVMSHPSVRRVSQKNTGASNKARSNFSHINKHQCSPIIPFLLILPCNPPPSSFWYPMQPKATSAPSSETETSVYPTPAFLKQCSYIMHS